MQLDPDPVVKITKLLILLLAFRIQLKNIIKTEYCTGKTTDRWVTNQMNRQKCLEPAENQ